jgi:3-hydroxyisobutyrate dehydrogenase-like beta-hydroxyacid dehydrogenase
VNFDLTAGLKDLNLFQQAFANENVVADMGSVVKNKLIAACGLGLGEKDWSALTEVSRLNAGLKLS